MSKRMTETRFQDIEQCERCAGPAGYCVTHTDPRACELLQALKAEREHIAELEANWDALIDTSIAASEKLQQRIAELEAELKSALETGRDSWDRATTAEAVLDEINEYFDSTNPVVSHILSKREQTG